MKMSMSALRGFSFYLSNRKVNFGDSICSKDRYDGHEVTGPGSAEHSKNCFVEVQCSAALISIQADFLQT